MQALFPDIKSNQQYQLEVSDLHTLYVEECGSPDGIPVLFIHGGPGAGSSPQDRRFFDPELYRIVLFDQRGCGRSTPHACTEANTLNDLVQDIEAIREHLGIERWVLFGGSWGATLALTYAESHPACVLGMILRGVFLSRAEDLQWFYQAGADRIFPDYWQEFVAPIAPTERGDLISAYHKILNGSNELAKMSAAKHWSAWEGRCATLRPNVNVVEHFSEGHTALALACIETHYFVNQSFLKPNQLIEEAGKLSGIPGIIVHGRYDMVCPLDNAFSLHQAWPEAELHIVRDAGHSALEPSIADALVKATNEMARQLGREDHQNA